MKFSQSYVLVLDHQPEDIQHIRKVLHRLRCPMVIAESVDQAIATALQSPPSLVLLAGHHAAAGKLVTDLRHIAQHCGITILSLADGSTPYWLHQEENPGFDGFLVKPLDRDVMVSLLQSAWARQAMCSAAVG